MIAMLFALYSVGITTLFLRMQRHIDGKSKWLSEAERVSLNTGADAPLEQLKVLSELAKIEQAQTPWFERSLSAVGVVAFFSMIIATGWQTVQASLGEAKLVAMQQEESRLRDEKKSMDTSLSQISRAISSQAREVGKVDDESRAALSSRLTYLRSQEKLDDTQVMEMCDLALLLDDSTTLIDAIQQDSTLAKRLKPADLVTLAEYYFARNSPGQASQVLDMISGQSGVLSGGSRLRVLVLRALIQGIDKIDPRQAADILQVSPEVAIDQLRAKMADLQRKRTKSTEASSTPGR